MEIEVIKNFEGISQEDKSKLSVKLQCLYDVEQAIICDMRNVRLDYLRIADRLHDIMSRRLFDELDCKFDTKKDRKLKNIYEYAYQAFGFKRTSVKNMISVYQNYCERERFAALKKEYELFSYSQLVEMLSLSPENRKRITPDMTVSQIRSFKAMLEQNKDCLSKSKDKKPKEQKKNIVYMIDYGKMTPKEIDVDDNDCGIFSTIDDCVKAIMLFKAQKQENKGAWVI
jgi:hypothetical protein